MNCSNEHADELRHILREELFAVKTQLDQLSSGQLDLANSIGDIKEKLESLLAPSPEGAEPSISADTLPTRDESHVWHSESTRRSKKQEIYEHRISHLLQVNDEVVKEITQLNMRYQATSFFGRLRLMLDKNTLDLLLDEVISFIIVLNAVFLGISSDYWNGELNIYFYIDLAFTITFFAECFIKVYVHTLKEYMCGRNGTLHILDVSIIVLDFTQLLLVVFARDLTDSMKGQGVPSASLFRTIRVIRVTRILRLIRLSAFEELLAMMEGVISGASTLFWAIILFALVVYVVALLCRDVLGQDEEYPEVFNYFKSVPRSIFTVFRCSFGDCSTDSGVPIPEFVNNYYGAVYSTFYCSMLFFITIGLFNVISAIFVDRTMVRLQDIERKKKEERLADEHLWATRVCTVLRRCFLELGMEGELLALNSGISQSMLSVEIPREVINNLCRHDQETIQALNDLGINQHDHSKLADILDPEQLGTIKIAGLINGLQCLRGLPRRSDIVTVDLMLRATQEKLDDIFSALSRSSTSKPVFIASCRKEKRGGHHHLGFSL